MAVGDQADVEARLQRLIPWSWFPLGLAPLYVGAIAGLAAVFAQIYSLLAYLRNQTRLATTTDGFLDLTAYDYFGNGGLPRRNGEQDPAYQQRIKVNLIRERVTRKAMVKVLQDLTGRTPIVIEPQRAADTGGYGAYNLAYGAAGCYGSRHLRAQAFVTAFLPASVGIPGVAGYGVPVAGYGVVGSQSKYSSLASIARTISDPDIFDAVNSVRPSGVEVWVQIATSS